MANYIMIVQLDIAAEHEDDFNRVYDAEHVPNLLNVSGVHGCDRYRLEESTDEGMARYAAVYHLDSPDIPDSDEWRAWADKEGEWVSKIRPLYTNRTRSIFKKI